MSNDGHSKNRYALSRNPKWTVCVAGLRLLVNTRLGNRAMLIDV